MNSNWSTVQVKDACELVVDCINNTAPTVDEETPYKMIRTSNIEDGHLNLDDVKYVTEEVYEEWTRRSKVNPGDVLLTREAPLGSVALVRDDDTIFLGQRIVQFRPDTSVLDPRYLSYAFLSPFVQAQIQKFKGTGSVVDHIRVPDCEEIEIPLPPMKYQKYVADILGSIDEKIRINNRICDTLEATSRTLFRSWFKEFNGFSTGQESELGPIPEGWVTGKLGDIMEKITNGVDPEEIPETTPYIGLKHMPQESITLSEWGEAAEVTSRKYRFESGQILFGRLRPYFCKVGIAPLDGISSTDIQVIQPKEDYLREFLLLQLSDPKFIDYCEKVSTGTRMPRVRWGDMCDYPIVIPSENVLRDFHDIIRPMYSLIVNNIHETKSLESARDTLLPKLVSGELGASDITLESEIC